MEIKTLCERYAKALIELIEKDEDLERISEQINTFANIMNENPDLFEAMKSDFITRVTKKEIASEIFEKLEFDEYIKNFITLVIDKGRGHLIPEMSESFDDLMDERLNRMTAEVTTPIEMTGLQEERLTQKLENLTKKNIRLIKKTNPKIYGGGIVKMGNIIIDGSIRNQIQIMQEELEKEL